MFYSISRFAYIYDDVFETQKKYLRFENDLENFEVDKIGFLIRVTLATNIYVCVVYLSTSLKGYEKKWFTTICCL